MVLDLSSTMLFRNRPETGQEERDLDGFDVVSLNPYT